MVYRKTAFAAMLAVVGIGGRAHSAEPQRLAIVEVGDRQDAGYAWEEIFALRLDLGGHLLVELDDATARRAEALGARVDPIPDVARGSALYRVSGATAVEQVMAKRMGRILWAADGELLVEVAHEPDVWSLAGQGVRLVKVPDDLAIPVDRAALERLANAAAPEYPVIDEMVVKVSGTNVQSYVQTMQDFGTRHSNLNGGTQAQAWLKQQFESMGFTQVAELAVPNITADNVCATLPGTTTPETVYVIGGHYDSTSTNTSVAPGADDNASGTAGVLEAARVMAGYSFESTIVFCGYAGEELGLLGSAAHAQALSGAGTNVAGMINLDMIGYLDAGDAVDIDVASNAASATLRSMVADVVARYVTGAQQVNGTLPQGASSDHASFQQRGFPAVMLFEDTGSYSPFIHTANDTVGTSFNSPDLAEKITRAAVATLAAMAVPSTAGPGPTPTPTPDPGDPGPGDPGNGMQTVHGGCACSVDATAAPSSLAPALLAALALLLRRRPH